MIVTDTTNVSTRKRNRVVTLPQKHCKYLGLTEPQYAGCQHHELDLILIHFLNQEFAAKTSSPNI